MADKEKDKEKKPAAKAGGGAPKGGGEGKSKGKKKEAGEYKQAAHAGADLPVPPPRLKTYYNATVRTRLKEQFGYKNPHEIPTVSKIVLNCGVGEAIKNPKVLDKVVETHGSGQMVSDDTVYLWQRRMIREEGIYAEPAGATALAGLAAAVEKGLVHPDDQVVCLVTGNGFKDLKSIQSSVGDATIPLIEVDSV